MNNKFKELFSENDNVLQKRNGQHNTLKESYFPNFTQCHVRDNAMINSNANCYSAFNIVLVCV